MQPEGGGAAGRRGGGGGRTRAALPSDPGAVRSSLRPMEAMVAAGGCRAPSLLPVGACPSPPAAGNSVQEGLPHSDVRSSCR